MKRLIPKHQSGKIINALLTRITPKVAKQLPKLIKSTPKSAITKTVQNNGKIRLSLPGSTNVQPRQIVLEPQGNNKFYVHIRTWDDVQNKVPATITQEEKQQLFDALYDELPDGAEILFPQSGPGNYATRGTVAGLQKLSRDPRFIPGSKGVLQYKDSKTGEIREFEGTSFIKK